MLSFKSGLDLFVNVSELFHIKIHLEIITFTNLSEDAVRSQLPLQTYDQFCINNFHCIIFIAINSISSL